MPVEHTSITIDASRRIGELSPFIFGNFVEHIRDHIEAIWAEVLSNRTFAVDSPQTPGLPKPWAPIRAPMSSFVSGILPPSERGLPRGVKMLAQKETSGIVQLELVVRQGVPLDVSVALKAEGTLENVRMRLVCPKGGQLAEAILKEISPDWKMYAATLVPAKASQHAEFELTCRGNGALSVGMVSVMPANAWGGIRAEVADMGMSLRPGILRYPGGCFADTYHWRDGIGPRTARPTTRNTHWGGIDTNDFGTNEFIHLCRILRAEPLLGINLGSGTPEEAAQWVQYCNGAPDTELGALRAKNGNPQPHGVTYWEIGNEIYGDWETGHCDAKTYAQKYLEFRKAMKAVDPTIQLLAVGHTDMDWNREVLSAADGEVEYLTMHFYQGAPPDADPDARYKAMLASPKRYGGLLAETAQLIDKLCKPPRPKIAVTEWNAMYANAAERTMNAREHTLEAALFNAGLLNVFMRNCRTVGICNFSDLVNGWAGGCIRLGDYIADARDRLVEGWSGVRKDIVYGTPSYYLLKAYATHAGAFVIGISVDGGAYDSPECGKIPAFQAVPLVDAVATLSRTGDEIAIFLINRDRFADIPARVSIANFRPAKLANVFVVTGDDPDDRNTPRYPESVGLVSTHISDVGTQFEYELPPCSLTVIVLGKAETVV